MNEDTKNAMNAVRDTHDLLPLPAYDINGDPIRPSQYERYLKGAVVEAHIALTSWVFTTRNPKAMTVPIIREILVISPPKPLVASPMKRKNIKDGPLTSPKKKRRM